MVLFGHVDTVHRIAYMLIGCLGCGLALFLIGWIVKRRKVRSGYDFKRRNDVEEAVWVDKSDATKFRETKESPLEASEAGSVVSPVAEVDEEGDGDVDGNARPDSPVRKVNNVRVVKSYPF